jgi:hypothetical protein
MERIIDCLVKAGYYRARISTLSDFDKIIGGMAWAMQLFSYDINIDIFYTDTLDLGQKISLTERLVMVLLASKCPYRIEPHQIVGLDYESLLPVIRWLIRRSEELRREHEAFNRLLALRHYHRVTGQQPNRSEWCHIVRSDCSCDRMDQNKSKPVVAPRPSLGQSSSSRTGAETISGQSIIAKIHATYKDNEQVSFMKLATFMRSADRESTSPTHSNGQHPDEMDLSLRGDNHDYDVDDDDDARSGLAAEQQHQPDNDETCFTDDDAQTTISDSGRHPNEAHADEGRLSSEHQAPSETQPADDGQLVDDNIELHKKLDLELLATNQKILNLLRKLDSMPGQLEIRQYQTRYVELHQQLIAKNKSVKKLFDLFNSLDVTKHYLEKELNLLDSISANLHLVNESDANRSSFMQQFNEIVVKILSIRDDMATKAASLRAKCDAMNDEYEQLLRQLDMGL